MLDTILELPAQAQDLVARRLWGREHFIVFRDHPIVYGRVPKAANSAIKGMLKRLLSVRHRNTSPDAYWKNHPLGETTMLRTRDAAVLPEERFVFTFVRNPLTRLASFYDNKVHNPQAALPETARRMGISKSHAFAEVVEIVCATPAHRMDVHVLPQSEMLVHRGRLVPRFVGRHESFVADWETLRQLVIGHSGLDVGEFRTRKTGSRPRDLADYYDERLTRLVHAKYAEDFRRFYPDLL